MAQRRTAPETDHTGVLLNPDARSIPPFEEIFGNRNPVEIEIGCGKGKFLIARAVELPAVNFLGVDVVWKWMRYAVERTRKRSLPNVKFIKVDARELIRYGIPPESVSIFHVYFPDPWPKRRHHKRRLITGSFLKELHARLVPDGLIELATDHKDYFIQMRSAVIRSGIVWGGVTEALDERLFEAAAKTNYELKYGSAGRKLRYLELKK